MENTPEYGIKNTSRRAFLKLLAGASLLGAQATVQAQTSQERRFWSLAKKLKPIGRALEWDQGYVWCNCPIDGPDGKVHVFFSRWKAERNMGGWLNGCEIAHAVANTPEEPFQ